MNTVRLFSTTLLCFLISTAAYLNTASANKLRTVALSGDPAPGTSASFYSILSSPVLNNMGQTAFRSSLTGTGINSDNARGIWSEVGGNSMELVARSGNLAPGTENTYFSSFFTTVLNDAGQIAFQAILSGSEVDSSNNEGIWNKGGGDDLKLVARTGNRANGTSGAIFEYVVDLVMNDLGRIAFRGFLTGSEVDYKNNVGIWWNEKSGSDIQLLTRTGNPAPGTLGGNFFNMHLPVLNNHNQTAFQSDVTGSGLDSSFFTSIWRQGISDGLQFVARSDNLAPGSMGAEFSDFQSTTINDAGQTAFHGFLAGLGVDNTNNEGIWSEGGGNGLEMIARTGNPAPGTLDTQFDSLSQHPTLNGLGQVAFGGRLTGLGVDNTNNEGIWSEGGGNGLEMIARTGNPAPGTLDTQFLALPSNVSLNGVGQTAFTGYLTGSDVDTNNDRGIWAQNQAGNLRLIAREGDQLDVEDGPGIDLRTISFLNFAGGTGNEDGRPSGFNDRGQLTFQAEFTDGSSGVFVSNLVAIPEPSGLVLLSIGIVALTARRPWK